MQDAGCRMQRELAKGSALDIPSAECGMRSAECGMPDPVCSKRSELNNRKLNVGGNGWNIMSHEAVLHGCRVAEENQSVRVGSGKASRELAEHENCFGVGNAVVEMWDLGGSKLSSSRPGPLQSRARSQDGNR